MFNADKPLETLISIAVLAIVVAAIMIFGSGANISKALRRGGVVVIGVTVLGLAGVGAALVLFGQQIWAALGVNIPSGG